eukprot:5392164-Pyramimonas_sp.AAC.1
MLYGIPHDFSYEEISSTNPKSSHQLAADIPFLERVPGERGADNLIGVGGIPRTNLETCSFSYSRPWSATQAALPMESGPRGLPASLKGDHVD